MAANEPVVASVAFLAAIVVTLVDGRHAVSYAALAAAAGLAPAVVLADGAGAALVILLGGGAAAFLFVAARRFAQLGTQVAGVDSLVPVVASEGALFGPRSVRVLAGALTLPAASWVSFNVPTGTGATVTGVMFPAALLWCCGGLRLLTARTVADISIGVGVVGLAGAAGWFLSGAGVGLPEAATAAGLAPAAAAMSGWLSGRRRSARATVT